MRERPTRALATMLVLGTLWCAFWAYGGQGKTPWEPWDLGWFVGWIFQYAVVGTLLLVLWRRHATPLLIVATPIAIQVLAYLVLIAVWYAFGFEGDSSDDSTFAEGFSVVAAGVLVGSGIVILTAIGFSAAVRAIRR